MAHPAGRPYSKTEIGIQWQVGCFYIKKIIAELPFWNCLLEYPEASLALGAS